MPNDEIPTFDQLAEPEPIAAFPVLDEIALDFVADELVVLDGVLVQFLYKEKGAGPHVFFNPRARETVERFTGELSQMMDRGLLIRPGKDAPKACDIENLTETEHRRLGMLLNSVRAKPRAKSKTSIFTSPTFEISSTLPKLGESCSPATRRTPKPSYAKSIE
jgi:hypothetical protein